MNETGENKATPMEKVATFIVDKRNLFFLLYIFAIIFCIIANGWVKVENDITTYLPDSTETRQGLTIMNDQFVTYGTARVMVSNISYEKEKSLLRSSGRSMASLTPYLTTQRITTKILLPCLMLPLTELPQTRSVSMRSTRLKISCPAMIPT